MTDSERPEEESEGEKEAEAEILPGASRLQEGDPSAVPPTGAPLARQ